MHTINMLGTKCPPAHNWHDHQGDNQPFHSLVRCDAHSIGATVTLVKSLWGVGGVTGPSGEGTAADSLMNLGNCLLDLYVCLLTGSFRQ